ncbi:MAG: SDR family NAD(P)-dependent oxidoreductase [Chloroflexi bacterium]|nr:SDR family NAD(P)-dependent oxidoreductase [Chloroflexota bacterium]
MTNLSEKIILITGGAQGIGAAAALECAARGATVLIADLNPAGEQIAAQIRASGGSAEFFSLDVRASDQVAAVTQTIQTRYARLDGVVCAAGVLRGAFQSPEELSVEEFEFVLDVNVKGVFLCAKHSAALLEASGNGVFVVLASGAGVVGPSSSLAYGASKGGANGLAMTLAARLEQRHIRVNTICPGNIVTSMKLSVEEENARRSGTSVEAAFEAARQKYGIPDGVAKIIAFVVSDDADYLRGALFTR